MPRASWRGFLRLSLAILAGGTPDSSWLARPVIPMLETVIHCSRPRHPRGEILCLMTEHHYLSTRPRD